ncbi:MAG: T9SS type A sorting domain-containing protein, partial [Flavobacteriales bacterium]
MQSEFGTTIVPSIGIVIRANIIDTIHGNLNLTLDSSATIYLKKNSSIIDSMRIHYYSEVTNLPNNTNGYYAISSHCFRVISKNIGYSCYLFYCKLADPAITGGNSNPEFVDFYDSLFLDINQEKKLIYNCFDSDGDSLAYSLINPLNRETIIGNGKPFSTAPWNFPYSYNDYIGIGSVCIINSSTGIISARSQSFGNFVIAVKCEEYRNGIKLGEVIRDILVPSHNTITSTKIKEVENKYPKLSVYPNPSNGNFTLSIEDYNHSNFNLNVIDITGKLVHYQQINSPLTSINLENLNKGIYFVQLNDGINQTTKRIVIQ